MRVDDILDDCIFELLIGPQELHKTEVCREHAEKLDRNFFENMREINAIFAGLKEGRS